MLSWLLLKTHIIDYSRVVMVGIHMSRFYNNYYIFCSLCLSQAFLVTMPHVYFEEHELSHCPWCGCGMVRSIVDVLCVDCSMFFTESLHPSGLWKEPISILPANGACDKKDYGDSAYEHSDIGTSCILTTDNEDYDKPCDRAGLSDLQIKRQLTMYDKLANAFKYTQTPLLLEEDLWFELIPSRTLSKCWVAAARGDTLVQLALPEFQCLSRYFTVEAPMGFLIINCTTRTTFHICNVGNVQSCSLRSACHYLRNYPRQTIGFVMTHAHEGFEEIAVVHCAASERSYRDRHWVHTSEVVMDRMLKVLISRYDHIAFLRGEMK